MSVVGIVVVVWLFCKDVDQLKCFTSVGVILYVAMDVYNSDAPSNLFVGADPHMQVNEFPNSRDAVEHERYRLGFFRISRL